MSTNQRIFYACQAVAIANSGTPIGNYGSGNMVHGVQSVGITTSFKLEQAFELGQIEIYENIEGVPDVELTMEKDIEGYPLIYLMATTGVYGTANSGLVARSKARCDIRVGIFDEAANNIASSTSNGGAAEVEIACTGMFVGSLTYKIPVEGNVSEAVSFVGNNKTWLTGGNVAISDTMAGYFDGNDAAPAYKYAATNSTTPASGVIQRRQHVMVQYCVLPKSIRGVVGTGVGNGYNATAGANYVHLQSVSISTDFSRNDLFELGKKTPFYRPANFPIEVKCDIEAITTSGDFVTAAEQGDTTLWGTASSGNNTQNETIYFFLQAGIGFDLGTKNRLSSVSYGGGDAKGGNVSTTYSYSNFNVFDVYQSGHNSTVGTVFAAKGYAAPF